VDELKTKLATAEGHVEIRTTLRYGMILSSCFFLFRCVALRFVVL
jgi:hypothetical protein